MEHGLPHTYSIHETEAVDESVEELIARPDFGGASVTSPYKLQIGRLLSSISPQVEKMGAVNTIVVKHIRVIVACVLADDLGEQIPEALFSETESGVVVEMAYRPPITGLMKRAGRYAGWKVFGGTDVLQEQAFAQFSMWTGRPAPALVMRESIQKPLYVRRETVE